jgi:catechol 2,3-dioxygenase-like lactoylglutathione lyase family enzyme
MNADGSLTLLVLRCADVQRSLEFYRSLGLSFTREQHGKGPEHFSCTMGELVLELYPRRDANADTSIEPARLGFRIGALEKVLEQLRDLNLLSTTQQDERGGVALVRDPDGRTVELTSAAG